MNVTPKLKIESTISNPKEPVAVMGFSGRNAKLGRKAIILKETAISQTGKVFVPSEHADDLLEGDADLYVLDGKIIREMDGETFAAQQQVHTPFGEPEITFKYVSRNSASFTNWKRDNVEVETK